MILIGSVSVVNMGSRAAGKDLERWSGPKTFQRKHQVEKTAIETNYGLKPGFFLVLFSITFFFNVNLSLQNASRYFTNGTVHILQSYTKFIFINYIFSAFKLLTRALFLKKPKVVQPSTWVDALVVPQSKN